MHLNGSGEMQEPQKIYNCQKCRDSGYYEIEKDGYTFVRECECGKIQRERIESKLRFAAIPKEFEGQTVDNFRTDCYSTPQAQELAKMAKLVAKRYVEKFPEIQEIGKGLYFHSNVKGSGKTRLAVSIANDLIKNNLDGCEVLYHNPDTRPDPGNMGRTGKRADLAGIHGNAANTGYCFGSGAGN